MAMSWDNVELIRNAQASAKQRFEATALATQDEIRKALESETAKALALPRITEIEQMIFKLRAELIDYIVAHGLVDGMIWNGQLQKVENGKIVITADMIDAVVKFLGYFQESDVQAFLEKYLPANDYVQDGDYVHTDNNYTDEAVEKLAGIENGAEVNKVINVMFNGKTVLDDGTRVANITITPEDIKQWYEENPNTNAFTDVEKTKLAGIADGADVNRVDDVIVNRQSVMNDQKQAIISKELIRDTYEANDGIVRFDTARDFKLNQALQQAETNTADIATVNRELNNAKDSISELGDEVNTVAGRVTTLEKRVFYFNEKTQTNFSALTTADMVGAGMFLAEATFSFDVNGVAKTLEAKFYGPGAVVDINGSYSFTYAALSCTTSPMVDEIGVVFKPEDIFRISGVAAGTNAWARNDVYGGNVTITKLEKQVGFDTKTYLIPCDAAEADIVKMNVPNTDVNTRNIVEFNFATNAWETYSVSGSFTRYGGDIVLTRNRQFNNPIFDGVFEGGGWSIQHSAGGSTQLTCGPFAPTAGTLRLLKPVSVSVTPTNVKYYKILS